MTAAYYYYYYRANLCCGWPARWPGIFLFSNLDQSEDYDIEFPIKNVELINITQEEYDNVGIIDVNGGILDFNDQLIRMCSRFIFHLR